MRRENGTNIDVCPHETCPMLDTLDGMCIHQDKAIATIYYNHYIYEPKNL